MNIFTVKNTKIKLDFPMLLLGALWIITGNGKTFFTMLFAVCLHEIAHVLTAKLFKLETESITIYIFGGAAEIKGIGDDHIKEGIIASFGPLASVFTGFLWQTGVNQGILPSWQEFVDYSYTIALINLLPVYPLDGGRILMCIFKGIFGAQKGRKIAVTVGVVISGAFFLKNIITLILWGWASGIVMAVFMLIASIKAIKKPHSVGLREKIWQKSENIKIIKAYGNESLLKVSKNFFGNSFFSVLVMDENHNIIGFLTEKQINDNLLYNSTFTLNEAIKHQRKQGSL